MLERRSFLRGLLLSVSATASTALVKLASPGEVTALTPMKDVLVGQPSMRVEQPDVRFDIVGAEVFIKTPDGFEPIGFIERIEINSGRLVDVTSLTGDFSIHERGIRAFRKSLGSFRGYF